MLFSKFRVTIFLRRTINAIHYIDISSVLEFSINSDLLAYNNKLRAARDSKLENHFKRSTIPIFQLQLCS